MSARIVKPGDVLGGKYRVERILGAGGMGIVVAAKHVDLGQMVALKFMLKEAMSDPAHAERFLREAKAAVQLKSNHTARVLDVGRLKNGEPFMVMEYLDGRDLDAEVHARGPLPPHVAVDYILQASEALAEAHGLGMIHRDVKLKNIFLTQTIDGRPLVKVLDFGLAKQLGSHGDVSLTATNSVFGSPQYMSPEQMRSAKDVDTRSDIWSLGVCLYELLTGRVPYDASGVAEICAMVLKDPVPPPSQFVLGLPVDLEAVVLKCLEKDVVKRFQSIAELGFALQHYAADEGSARRILHVMESAQKIEHPTIVTNTQPIDAGPKTMNAWDSGLPTRRTTQLLTRQQWAIAISFLLTVCVVGIGLIVFTVKKKNTPTTFPAFTGQSYVAPLDSPPLLPPVDSAPAPTATIVAAPDTADTSNPPPPDPTSHPTGTGTGKPSAKPRPTTPTHPPTATTTAKPPPTPPTTNTGKPPTKPPKSGDPGDHM